MEIAQKYKPIILSLIILFTNTHVYSESLEKRGLLVSKEMQKDPKLGLNIANKFRSKIGWFYTYNHTLSDEWIKWANKNKVFFCKSGYVVLCRPISPHSLIHCRSNKNWCISR